MKLFLLLLLVMGCVAPAVAGEAPIKVLYTEVSKANESLDAFVLRISRKAVKVGKAHQAEVCGAIDLVEGTYTLTLRSNLSMNTCDIAPTLATVATFHTHIETGGSTFGDGDYSAPGYLAIGTTVLFQAGKGTERRLTPGA